MFAGTRDHSVVAWEPPKQQLEETVSLGGHTGWVRSLATSGQWLFSASCSTVRAGQRRAVPGMRQLTVRASARQSAVSAR